MPKTALNNRLRDVFEKVISNDIAGLEKLSRPRKLSLKKTKRPVNFDAVVKVEDIQTLLSPWQQKVLGKLGTVTPYTLGCLLGNFQSLQDLKRNGTVTFKSNPIVTFRNEATNKIHAPHFLHYAAMIADIALVRGLVEVMKVDVNQALYDTGFTAFQYLLTAPEHSVSDVSFTQQHLDVLTYLLDPRHAAEITLRLGKPGNFQSLQHHLLTADNPLFSYALEQIVRQHPQLASSKDVRGFTIAEDLHAGNTRHPTIVSSIFRREGLVADVPFNASAPTELEVEKAKLVAMMYKRQQLVGNVKDAAKGLVLDIQRSEIREILDSENLTMKA